MVDQLLWKLKGTNSTFTSSKLITLPCTVKSARGKLKEECGLQNVAAIDFVLYLATDESSVLPDSHMLEGQCQVLVTRCSASEASKLISSAEHKSVSPPVGGPPSMSLASSIEFANAGVNMNASRMFVSENVYASSPRTASIELERHNNANNTSTVSIGARRDSHNSDDAKSAPSTDENEWRPDSERKRVNFLLEKDEKLHSSDADGAEGCDDSYSVGGSAVQSDDEDYLIQAAMQERDVFGGEGQDSLTRRYYRNRTVKSGSSDPSGSEAVGSPRRSGTTVVGERPQYGPGMYTAPRTVFMEPMTQEIVPVDASYICHMCGQRGHHIRNCVQPEGKRLHKKIRPATGIPVDFLDVINEDDIGKYEEVYQLKTGQFAVMKDMSKVSGGAFFTKSADQRIQSQLGISDSGSKSMVRGLRCNVCNNFFNNPVATLCCGESFCLDCVLERSGGRSTLDLNNTYKCPNCDSALKYSDLQVNTSLKHAVDTLVLTKEVDSSSHDTSLNATSKRKAPVGSIGCRMDNVRAIVDINLLKRQRIMASSYLAKIKH